MTLLRLLLTALAMTASYCSSLNYQDISPEVLEAEYGGITSDSPIGARLLSSASRVDVDGDANTDGNDSTNDNTNRQLEDNEEDTTWLANYALKFQGCHHIKQWNENADDENDVKIQTYRLVRFRLCPVNSCSSRYSTGCRKGYGDYVVDMSTYIQAYTESKRRMQEYQCQLYAYNNCDCQDTDDKGDDFDRDICEYDCYSNGRKSACIDRNPYDDEDAESEDDDEREMERYLEDGCSEFEIPEYDDDDGNAYYGYGNRNRERVLEDESEDSEDEDEDESEDSEDEEEEDDDDDDDDEEEEEVAYYIGAYCGDQGGKIYVGMFTDDTCTNFADKNSGRTTYKTLTRGKSLPYSTSTVVGNECITCLEQDDLNEQNNQNQNNNNNQYYDDEINVMEGCIETYDVAGKCETKMNVDKNGGPESINEAGCYFIEGVKIVRKDGILNTSWTRPNKVVSFFIFLFAVSFILLGAYIYYLRMKLDTYLRMKLGMKINLN